MMSDWTAHDMAKTVTAGVATECVVGKGCNSMTACRAQSRCLAATATGDANPKDIAGASKPQLHLIPACAEVAIARVMETGAAKYGPYNWRHKPVRYTPYINAARRHLLAFADGEVNDPESGQPHLAHAASTIMILLDAIQNGCAVDDRVKAGDAGLMINPIGNRGKVVMAEPYAAGDRIVPRGRT